MPSPDAEKRAQALLEQGASLYEEGKLYDALSCWKQVLQLDPQNEIATEYLRFIEDNFQIGVDAFMEHHDREPDSLAAASIEIESDIVTEANESYEELDWSEILDEGPDRNLKKVLSSPVPPDLGSTGGDDDFFAELEDPPPQVGESRALDVSWGGGDEPSDSGVMMSLPAQSSQSALQPETDPLSMPAGRFAAPYRPPVSADLPSSPSESPGNGTRRRRTSAVEAVTPNRRRTSGARSPDEAAAASDEHRSVRGRDMAEMGDESIQKVLDDEFKVWDESVPGGRSGPSRRDVTPPRGPPTPQSGSPSDDVDDLEALLSRGLGELPSGPGAHRPPAPIRAGGRSTGPQSGAARSSGPPSGAGRSSGPQSMGGRGTGQQATGKRNTGSQPAGKRNSGSQAAGARGGNDLESLVRHGLAEMDNSGERRSTGRQLAAPPGAGMNFPAASPGADLDDLMVQARRKQAVGDFSGSLHLVEQVLSANTEHVEARRFLTENTARLLEMYRSKLGKLSHRPKLKLRQQEIIWQSLDHRAGFLLSQVDGKTTYEDIIDIAGLPELEATRILAKLVDQGAIG